MLMYETGKDPLRFYPSHGIRASFLSAWTIHQVLPADPYREYLPVTENDEDILPVFWYVMMEEGRNAFRNMLFLRQERNDICVYYRIFYEPGTGDRLQERSF